MYMPFQREYLALLKRAKSTTDRSVKKIDTEHDLYVHTEETTEEKRERTTKRKSARRRKKLQKQEGRNSEMMK